jgi:crotonobetainyl-CoA:carnitine CoA-transferase CaiB-like acyl-CoA transferase
VKHIGAATTVKSPKLGEIRIVDQAVKLSRTPARMAVAPPEVGEHTDEILKDLGYDRSAVEDFRKNKVV